MPPTRADLQETFAEGDGRYLYVTAYIRALTMTAPSSSAPDIRAPLNGTSRA